MKRRCKDLLLCSAMAVCFAAFLFTGCGKEETPEEDTKISEQTEDDSVEPADEKQPEEATEPEAEETEETGNEADKLNETEQPWVATVYFVDDPSGEVIGEGVKVQDEYDIWTALQEKGILTDDCELVSLNVNRDKKKIDLDFNAATGKRINSMGTTGETEIIGCMINTYLDSYDCEKIRITEEGQDFETSHGAVYDDYVGWMTFEG